MEKQVVLKIDNYKINAILFDASLNVVSKEGKLAIKLLKEHDFLFFDNWKKDVHHNQYSYPKTNYVKNIIMYDKNSYRNKKISKINGINISIPTDVFYNCYPIEYYISNNFITINFDYFYKNY